MPDPITSSRTPTSSGFEPDPTLDSSGQVCRGDVNQSAAPASAAPPSAGAPPSGASKLVSAVPPPPVKLPPATSNAENNAQRTSERSGISPYFQADLTGGARDSVHAGAAALKGRDAKSGIEVEVFSASGQVGGENEAQVGLARVGVSKTNGNASAEFFTARASGGAHNDDGSIGFNAGAIATIAGAEGTLQHGGDSLTVGISAGVGAAFSVGLRDIDHNGTPELCVKVSAGFATLGICAED
jgi:hypothetical protein